ncbi:MAG: Ni/Fe hydrogenase subunit alpha [Polyangiales bacterium]
MRAHDDLETASNPEGLSRVVIEPITRVEGHGKVTLLLDEDRRVRQARLHIVEFRGFERFIVGRPFWELPTMVQRLCGICPVSHLLAASKACDAFVLGHGRLTPTAEKLRRFVHFGQVLQSNALHFFHLASPDLLFGADDDVAHRNLVGVLADHPDVALRGVKIRKYGQEVIRHLTGKRVHGTGAVPGGYNKRLLPSERDEMANDIGTIVEWCADAVVLARDLFLAELPGNATFGAADGAFLSLVRPDGGYELYDGGLRVKDENGTLFDDHVPSASYGELIHEEIKNWSYLKFPFLRRLGTEAGRYRVGPLARVNNCDFIPTPRAEAARREFLAFGGGKPVQATLSMHWARMIDMLHCAESLEEMLRDPELLGDDLMAKGEPLREGVGILEAPRGTLIHHYQIGEDDLVTMANLIVSTTHNNHGMNESVRAVADSVFDGRELTEGMLNRIEVAIRAYDPCLSCATHALGKMPLAVELLDAEGKRIDRATRDSEGAFVHEGA